MNLELLHWVSDFTGEDLGIDDVEIVGAYYKDEYCNKILYIDMERLVVLYELDVN